MVVFSIIYKEHVLLTISDGVVEDLGLKVGLLLVVSPDSLFLLKVEELTERDSMWWVSLDGLHRVLPLEEFTEFVRSPSLLNLDSLIIKVYL